jgi:hypothetical protein
LCPDAGRLWSHQQVGTEGTKWPEFCKFGSVQKQIRAARISKRLFVQLLESIPREWGLQKCYLKVTSLFSLFGGKKEVAMMAAFA